MIALIRCLLERDDPMLRREILHLETSNLRLKAQIFRLQCSYVLLNLRADLLYLRIKFWIWFYVRVLHARSPYEHEANTNATES